MKVNEICGAFCGMEGYQEYYYTKMGDRNVILARTLSCQTSFSRNGTKIGLLRDYISFRDAGNDDKSLEQEIQSIIEFQKEDAFVREPLQMQKGRETDLSLVNIKINSSDDPQCAEIANYLKSKKLEEIIGDRSKQLKEVIQNNAGFYSLQEYLKKYENQSGNKLGELQIEGIRKLDERIQAGVIVGKYNLVDYNTFLLSIPALLSRKEALGIGDFDSGVFWVHGEIYEKRADDIDISEHTTYTFAPYDKREDIYNRKQDSSSINKRMRSEYRGISCINMSEENKDLCYLKPEEQESIKLCGIEKYPDVKVAAFFKTANQYVFYTDNSGILFAGMGRLQNPKEPQTKLSADDIAIDLAEISRKVLTDEVQVHLTELADEGKKRDDEKSEEKL